MSDGEDGHSKDAVIVLDRVELRFDFIEGEGGEGLGVGSGGLGEDETNELSTTGETRPVVQSVGGRCGGGGGGGSGSGHDAR